MLVRGLWWQGRGWVRSVPLAGVGTLVVGEGRDEAGAFCWRGSLVAGEGLGEVGASC